MTRWMKSDTGLSDFLMLIIRRGYDSWFQLYWKGNDFIKFIVRAICKFKIVLKFVRWLKFERVCSSELYNLYN